MRKNLRCFTLIELLVVLGIISILFFIVTPRLVSVINPHKTRYFLLRLKNKLAYVNHKCILQNKVYLFNFNQEEKKYYFTVSEQGNITGEVNDRYLTPDTFPPGLAVEKLEVIPGGEVVEDKLVVPFTPNGLYYSFRVFITQQEQRFLIEGNSFSDRIEVFRLKEDIKEKL